MQLIWYSLKWFIIVHLLYHSIAKYSSSYLLNKTEVSSDNKNGRQELSNSNIRANSNVLNAHLQVSGRIPTALQDTQT